MENNENIKPVPFIYSGEGITLPLGEDDFKEFIVSLLGKPELLEGYVEGAFSIGFAEIKNINYQLDHRISQQNDSTFLQFTAKLFFDDYSSLSFSSLDKFLSYRESRPVICKGFDFTWVYLIRFGKKNMPERQEIRLFSKHNVYTSNNYRSSKGIGRIIWENMTGVPKINYSIRCTANTWGFEIAELLKTLLIDTSIQSTKFIRSRKILISSFTSSWIALTLFILIFLYWKEGDLYQDSAQKIDALVNQGAETSEIVTQILHLLKVDLLINSLPNMATLLIMSFSISIVLGIAILEVIRFPNHFFLLFNDRSIQNRKASLARDKKRKLTAFVGVTFSILLGVMSNYIFEYLQSL